MSVLDPLTHALAAALAAAHHGLTTLGAPPTSGPTWLASIAVLVVVVRLVLLPLAVHGVRNAHAAARARPALEALARRYRNRTGSEAIRARALEQRAVHAEHGVSRWRLLTAVAQVPIWLALLHLVGTVADGHTIGAMDQPLVASLGAAVLMGVPLADRGYVGAGSAHLAVVGGLALTAALLGYLTQRHLVLPSTLLGDVPPMIAGVQQWLPVVSAGGLLVAGGLVPVALLGYWVLSATWTAAQSAVVWRWFPTPGSPAARRRA